MKFSLYLIGVFCLGCVSVPDLEFIIATNDAETYPGEVKDFERAVESWSDHLDFTYHIEISDNDIGLGKVIRVDFVDMSKELFLQETVGLWDYNRRIIFLDICCNDLIYPISLHELGHVFGLGHFANIEDQYEVGSVIVQDADTYIMYGRMSPRNMNAEISPLEINLALRSFVSPIQECKYEAINRCRDQGRQDSKR